MSASALHEAFPGLERELPRVALGRWPSPLESKTVTWPSGVTRELLVKCEDRSAEGYAGNKIRPLELVFGAALAAGRGEIWATGAYGSNHALAAAVHAKRQGLRCGAILWPQPWSETAVDNLRATASVADALRFAGSVGTMVPMALCERARPGTWVMPPGAATPLGAMGHASAALELGLQLEALGLRKLATLVLPVGSTCTTTGMLVGTALAHALGLLVSRPRITAVRVTPWPVTDPWRIAHLAARTATVLTEHIRRAGHRPPALPLSARDYRPLLEVTGDELGGGYGRPTPSGLAAMAAFAHAGIRLDTTYSCKAAAHLEHRRTDGPIVFWSTKSACPLPAVDAARLAALPSKVSAWLEGPRGALFGH
jgi:D-cysteine desulfhydrase